MRLGHLRLLMPCFADNGAALHIRVRVSLLRILTYSVMQGNTRFLSVEVACQ